jgi:hypothetical protein
MRHARWTAPLLGLALTAALATPASATTSAQAARTQSILKAALLSATDVPPTFQAKKPTDSLSKDLKRASACKALASAVDAAKKAATRKLSPQFEDPTANSYTYADNTAYVFKSATGAQSLLAGFQATDAPTCLQATTEKGLGKALKGLRVSVTVTTVNNLTGVGDGAIGYEANVNLAGKGPSVTLIIDFVGVQVGRAFLGFTFGNQDHTISNGLGMINAVVDRTKAAGA